MSADQVPGAIARRYGDFASAGDAVRGALLAAVARATGPRERQYLITRAARRTG